MVRTKRPPPAIPIDLPHAFCLVNVKGFSSKSKIAYLNLDSARRFVPLDASMSIPLPLHGVVESLLDDVEDNGGKVLLFHRSE